jgi:hypothetical protein
MLCHAAGPRRAASCCHQHCDAGRIRCSNRGRPRVDQPARLDLSAACLDADPFDDGGTPEFAAISAVARHRNYISNTLSTVPHRFQPMHRRKPNRDVDAPGARRFHAAMRLRLLAWRRCST